MCKALRLTCQVRQFYVSRKRAGHETGLEAGRLAAIRAEVENHVRWLDERLPEREGCHPDDFASQGETRQMYVELRDLCRWLEVTR